MIGDVFVHLRVGRGDRLQHIAQAAGSLGLLVANAVVSFFQLLESVNSFLLPSGNSTVASSALYSSISFCLLALADALLLVSSS